MDKAEAIRIITQCAKTYQTELNNKNVLFVYMEDYWLRALECSFLPRHFLHLTGVRFSGSSSNFLRLCVEHKLSPQQISLSPNGTTEMKLQVLPELVNIHRTARMIGPYNQSKVMLYTEKLIGNVRGCMGFVADGDYYVPNTVLREDIRNITLGCKRMIAVFVKDIGQPVYTEVSLNTAGHVLCDIKQEEVLKRYFYNVDSKA
ncbi:MAG: PBECR4 domain-containing protein [Clostridiaceae bacterium]